MEKDLEQAKQGEGVSAEQHKHLAGGIPERHWNLALVRRTQECVCREQVQELGWEAYVASQKETHVYASRNRREVEHILIPNIVFIRLANTERVTLMKQCPLIYKFMTDKAGIANEFGRQPYALVTDREMEQLQYMLYHADSPVNFTDHPLRKGDTIRVVRGKLKGLEGNYLREGKNAYIVISIGSLGCAMANVSIGDIERVN